MKHIKTFYEMINESTLSDSLRRAMKLFNEEAIKIAGTQKYKFYIGKDRRIYIGNGTNGTMVGGYDDYENRSTFYHTDEGLIIRFSYLLSSDIFSDSINDRVLQMIKVTDNALTFKAKGVRDTFVYDIETFEYNWY